MENEFRFRTDDLYLENVGSYVYLGGEMNDSVLNMYATHV